MGLGRVLERRRLCDCWGGSLKVEERRRERSERIAVEVGEVGALMEAGYGRNDALGCCLVCGAAAVSARADVVRAKEVDRSGKEKCFSGFSSSSQLQLGSQQLVN